MATELGAAGVPRESDKMSPRNIWSRSMDEHELGSLVAQAVQRSLGCLPVLLLPPCCLPIACPRYALSHACLSPMSVAVLVSVAVLPVGVLGRESVGQYKYECDN